MHIPPYPSVPESVRDMTAPANVRTHDEIRAGLTGLSGPADWWFSTEVNHPAHYTSHPSGVEAITITEHMNFCLGSAMKYIWRAGLKDKNRVKDLEKARWFLNREIERLGGAA